jgi:hypothetical protein
LPRNSLDRQLRRIRRDRHCLAPLFGDHYFRGGAAGIIGPGGDRNRGGCGGV